MTDRALTGIKVIDLTQALAGPYCTALLADHGAEVIKIEPPKGDMLRYAPPFSPDDTERPFGAVFFTANRNKKGIVLDLKAEADREQFLSLVREADVLVENFSAGVMERLGLSYEALARLNPRLVYTSVRGFGDRHGGESPYLHWPAFDIVAQAMSGLMSITGTDSQHPVRVGAGLGDTVPALFAAYGTMLALWEARRSGQGQYVDVSMVDALLAVAEVIVNEYGHTGRSPAPKGNQIVGFCPFDTFRAQDGVVALGAPHRPQWATLCNLMQKPELVDDPRFATDNGRWENREAVYEIVGEFVGAHTVAELMALLGGKVPLGPVFKAEDIFHDPHFAVRTMLPRVPHPGTGGEIAISGVPVKLSRTPGAVVTRAPLLGEHTSEILGSLAPQETTSSGEQS